MSATLEAARKYHALGWSLLPIKAGTKKAAASWKRFQRERPNDADLGEWFSPRGKRGIAIVCGAVSGGLCVRDFDQQEAFDRWAESQPTLAATLPTVATARGRHVYFKVEAEDLREVRQALGKPKATGPINCGDGELRAGGGYVLAPPSVHPSGTHYRWIREPFAANLPTLDLRANGLISVECAACATESNREHRENGDSRKTTDAMRCVGSGEREIAALGRISADVEAAIVATLPSGAG